MPVRKLKKSGTSIVGSFPSLKLGKTVRYESTLERDFLYFLEFDPAVSSYETQPFTVQMTLDDGKVHAYTPDLRVIQNDLPFLIEIKPFAHLEREGTLQQITIGEAWAGENDHHFQVVTDQEIRRGPRLENLKILFRYARVNISGDLLVGLRKLFPAPPLQIPFGAAAAILGARAKPYLWSLLFHHYLETDLEQKLSDASLLTPTDRSKQWLD